MELDAKLNALSIKRRKELQTIFEKIEQQEEFDIEKLRPDIEEIIKQSYFESDIPKTVDEFKKVVGDEYDPLNEFNTSINAIKEDEWNAAIFKAFS